MKILTFLLFFLIVTSASAAILKVGVKTEIRGNISALFFNASNGVLKISAEFYNTGSVAYKARSRLDVFNSTELIFTGWSKEERLMPGERKNFELYWFTQEKKNVTARLRFYYGWEMAEREVELEVEKNLASENIFQLKNFRVYEDHIKFQIRSSKPLKEVLIISKDYLPGWIFEQKKVESLEENRNTEITIPYEASVWTQQNITIEVFTQDGKHYSSYSFPLEKERGILKYLHYLIDWLSLALNL